MPLESSLNGFEIPEFSSKTKRSRKKLAEKIRELGVKLRSERSSSAASTSTQKIQYMVVKIAGNPLSKISIMTPNLNLEQITYYQPEISREESSSDRNVYKIDKFETNSSGPKELQRISDIEVKSFKPKKKIKFRRKKRQSSVTFKIEEIFNRGKEIPPSRDPSEETIVTVVQEQEEPPKEITDLPESILQKIFFRLTKKERILILPRVCKYWYYILKDPIFWKELDFTGNKVPTEVIIELLRRYPSLESLRLTSVPDTVEILQELCRCNDDIKQLGVRHCDVSSIDFARIILHVVSCCINIEVLDIKGMKFQSERFYLELGRLKNLKSINLTGNTILKSQDLITLSVNCRALQDLRILDTNLTSSMGTALRDDDLIFIASHLKENLNTLKIDMHQLGNVSYQAILKCSLLERLILKNCLLLTSDVFRQFIGLKNLKKLKMTRAINIKAEDFQFVFSSENMQNVSDLDLNGCWNIGDNGLRAILNRLSNSLKFLSLKNCKSIKRNHLTLFSSCPKLVQLNLAHTDLESGNLMLLPEHNKNLSELVVSSEVSSKLLRQLKKSFPSLTVKISFSEYQKDEKIFNV